MKTMTVRTLIPIVLLTLSCNKQGVSDTIGKAFTETRKITFNSITVNVIIDKPENDTVDVIVAYHGTVFLDNKILEAAQTTLNEVKRITDRKNMMIVSVAYPEEGLFMGDNVRESEAALLWVKNNANRELGVVVKKIFLVGHSQGGYIVTRLNTKHATDGVVANGPGPLDLVLRYQLEENNQAPNTITCTLLKNAYGSVLTNPAQYRDRSLLNFTNNFQSDILFIQGLQDSQIQLTSWPTFKQQVQNCTTCKRFQFLDIADYGHTALFDSPEAKQAYNNFINR